MALSDKRTKIQRKRAITKPGPWGDVQKLEAVKMWLLTGNVTHTAAALSIPLRTLRLWRTQQWWGKAVEEVQNAGKIVLNNKLQAIASKALDATEDRLDNGDWIFDQKTGELRRKPVAMRDARQVANDFINLAKRNEPKTEPDTKIGDHLQQLADAFSNFSKKTTRIEVIDAIPNERQERLPEGTQVGDATSRETPSTGGT